MANENGLKSGFAAFWSKNSKKIIISLSVFFTLLVVIGCGYLGYQYYLGNVINKDVVARVGDKPITRSQYVKAKDQCLAGLSFSKSEDSKDTCDEKAINDLVYLEALRQEAVKNNIDVTAKVDAAFKEFVSGYKSEQEALAAYKRDFALEKADIRNNEELRALEGALSDKLVKQLSVVGGFVSYDFFDDTDGKESAVNDATALVKKYFEPALRAGKSKLELSAIAEKLRSENPKYQSFTGTAANITAEDSLNDSNYDKFFQNGNKTDWAEIKKLNNVGDTTPVFTSPAGFVVTWRLESRNGGDYDSLDDFRNKAVEKSKVTAFEYKVRKIKMAFLKTFFPAAYAACVDHMGGLVSDHVYFVDTTTEVANNSIEIRFSENTTNASSGYTTGCANGVSSGTSYPYNGSFTLGDDATYLNCNSRWNILLTSRNGTFFDLRYVDRSFPSNGTNIRIDRELVDCEQNGGSNCDVHVESYYNKTQFYTVDSDTSEFGDNDKIVVVRPNHPPVARYVSPADNYQFNAGAVGATVNVSLTADATDPDAGDDVAVQVVYKKSTDTAWKSFGCIADSNGPASPANTATLYSSPTCSQRANYKSDYGWSPGNPSTGVMYYMAQGTDHVFPSQALAAGTYNWTVRARDEHGVFSSEWLPARTFTVVNPPVADASCGVFTAPASVVRGSAVSATLVMNNTGTKTWTAAENYKLGSQTAQDNTTWGLSRVALPATTSPGGTATFTINGTAPATAGTYNFDWKMLQESVAWFGSTCTKTITVTNPTYTLTYNGNSNTSGTVPASQTGLASAATVATRTNTGSLSKSCYAFGGWNDNAAGTGVQVAAGGNYSMPRDADDILYAKWNPGQFSLIYDANGGTNVPTTVPVAYGAQATVSRGVPTRTGYAFAGWNTAANGSGTNYSGDNTFAMPCSNVTLYAKWTINTYTVTFDKNDVSATGSMTAESFTFGQTKPLTANAFAKTGYGFAGWATTSTGAVLYANQANYTMGSANVTLYAKWTAVSTCSLAASPNNFKANGSTNLTGTTSLTVTFTFGAPSNQTSYVIDFGTKDAFGNPVLSANNPTSGATTYTYGAGNYTASLSCQPNGASQTVTINVSGTNEAPRIFLDSPADNASAGSAPQAVPLSAHLTDTEGKATHLIIGYYDDVLGIDDGYVTDFPSTPASGVPTLSATLTTLSLPAGNYTWYAYGYDDQVNAAGEHTNISPVATRSFTVEVPAGLSCTVSPDDVVEVGSPVEVTITPTGSGVYGPVAGPYILRYFLTSNGPNPQPSQVTTINPVNSGRNITFDAAGTYTIQVQDTPDDYNLSMRTCTTTLVVSEPSGSGGGEKL